MYKKFFYESIKEPILEALYWDGDIVDAYGNKRPITVFRNQEWETLKKQIEIAPIRFLYYDGELYTWEASKATHDMIIMNLIGVEHMPEIFKGVFLDHEVRVNKEGISERYLEKINDLSNYLYDGDFEVEWNKGL